MFSNQGNANLDHPEIPIYTHHTGKNSKGLQYCVSIVWSGVR